MSKQRARPDMTLWGRWYRARVGYRQSVRRTNVWSTVGLTDPIADIHALIGRTARFSFARDMMAVPQTEPLGDGTYRHRFEPHKLERVMYCQPELWPVMGLTQDDLEEVRREMIKDRVIKDGLL